MSTRFCRSVYKHDGRWRMALERLTGAQRKQVERQLQDHRHARYEVDLRLGRDRILHGFVVCPNVLRPERMIAISLARHLCKDRKGNAGRRVLDMGCGSGLQGIAMLEAGALHATFSDISPQAVGNARENIDRFVSDKERRAVLYQGDLFSAIPPDQKFDRIVFNHPFFGDDPLEEPGAGVSSAMLDRGTLVRRFFAKAAARIVFQGDIIMPYFEPAGSINHPTLGEQFGYRVSCVLSRSGRGGLQRGNFSIYKLSRV